MDINELTLLGTIKEISNIRTFNNGQKCCWLLVLTDVSFQKKDGTIGSEQVSHRVIAYGKYANAIKENASINQKIFIQGKIKTNESMYNNMSFQKTFIILERFKLHPIINESIEPEGYSQSDDVIEDDNLEEDSDYNEDININDDDSWDYYYDIMGLLENSKESGWYYGDVNDDEDLEKD